MSNFFFSLVMTSLKDSFSQRGTFALQSLLMLINNLTYFLLWWIFFQRFPSIEGWSFQDMAYVMAIGMGGYGLMQVFFGGVKDLSYRIIQGELDPLLTQPKNILLHLIASKSRPNGFGDLITAALLLTMNHSLVELPLAIFTMCSSCIVFTSMHIFAHSLTFWMGNMEDVAKKYCESILLFAVYPMNIYSGLLQIILFTALPAGIIGYLPVSLLHTFSIEIFFILIGSVFLIGSCACLTFFLGLKYYRS